MGTEMKNCYDQLALHWSYHSNKMKSLPIFLAAAFLGTFCVNK